MFLGSYLQGQLCARVNAHAQGDTGTIRSRPSDEFYRLLNALLALSWGAQQQVEHDRHPFLLRPAGRVADIGRTEVASEPLEHRFVTVIRPEVDSHASRGTHRSGKLPREWRRRAVSVPPHPATKPTV